MTNPYKINGTNLLLEPSTARWLPRPELGIDGAGHPIYPAVREFVMTWNGLSPEEYSQLQGFFNAVITTGTAIVELPEYAKSTYAFRVYSGCTLSEPEPDPYFTENYLDVSFRIRNIHT